MKKAILFGATGFIGSHLLLELLNNESYEKVTIVVRKDINIKHTKLNFIPHYRLLYYFSSDLSSSRPSVAAVGILSALACDVVSIFGFAKTNL